MEKYIMTQHKELQEHENRYHFIAEHTKDMILTMDKESLEYTYVSDSCLFVTGFSREEYLKLSIYDTLPPESVERLKKKIQLAEKESLAKNLSIEANYKMHRYLKNGELILVTGSLILLENAEGKFAEVLMTEQIIE